MKIREKKYGTFAVTTNENYNRLPANVGTSFRLTNLSGKIIGIRNRHSVGVFEDFESGYTAWTIKDGSFEKYGGLEIEGANSGHLMGRIIRELPTISKESIIEIQFRILHGSVKIGFFDTPARTDLITGGISGTTVSFESGGAITTSAPSTSTATWQEDTTYRLAIEVHPDTEVFTAELFQDEARQNIAQGLDATNDNGGGGGIVTPMEDFQICIEGTSVVVDEILLLGKESYPSELLTSGSSYVFPCQRAIDEYEIINLGSDIGNFSDNTDSVTLTGFYQA